MRALFSDLKSQKISIHWLLKVVALQLRLAHLKTLLQQVCNISRASHQANLNNNYSLEFAPSSVIMPKIIKQNFSAFIFGNLLRFCISLKQIVIACNVGSSAGLASFTSSINASLSAFLPDRSKASPFKAWKSDYWMASGL